MSQDSIKEMFSIGAHIGYGKTRRHPTAQPFIFTTKQRTDLIDLTKTAVQLEKAEAFLKELGLAKKNILLVSTKAEGRTIIKDAAEKLDMPYINERWIGGTLTNFPEINRRISLLRDLLDKKEKNELVFKTKKELLMIEREIERLTKRFGGLVSLMGMPDAIIVIDPRHEDIAILEAKTKNIPVIALANTDCNMKDAEYMITANDTSVTSIKYFVQKLVTAYESGREESVSQTTVAKTA
jgi:small subunit ribosomal protein S2